MPEICGHLPEKRPGNGLNGRFVVQGSAKEKGALSRFHPIKTVLIFFQKKSKTTHATSCLKIAPILM
jgi:hypothetical protein